MALKIRLARAGAKKRPFYRIVVADSRSPRDGRFIEKLGVYNPLLPKDNDNRLSFDSERIKHWLDRGAQPTDRVARFLSTVDLVSWQHGNNPEKAKPKAKAQERLREAEEAKQAAADAAAEAAAAPAAPAEEAPAAPAEEAPAEEAPAEEAAAEAEAPAAEAPAEEAPAQEAAAEEAPAEEAAAEEAPAEEAPAEEATEDEKKAEA